MVHFLLESCEPFHRIYRSSIVRMSSDEASEVSRHVAIVLCKDNNVEGIEVTMGNGGEVIMIGNCGRTFPSNLRSKLDWRSPTFLRHQFLDIDEEITDVLALHDNGERWYLSGRCKFHVWMCAWSVQPPRSVRRTSETQGVRVRLIEVLWSFVFDVEINSITKSV